jgi:hypothetical protein
VEQDLLFQNKKDLLLETVKTDSKYEFLQKPGDGNDFVHTFVKISNNSLTYTGLASNGKAVTLTKK